MADKIDPKPAKDEADKAQPLKEEIRVNVEVDKETVAPEEPSDN